MQSLQSVSLRCSRLVFLSAYERHAPCGFVLAIKQFKPLTAILAESSYGGVKYTFFGGKAAGKMAIRRGYHQHGRISLGKHAFIREGPVELSNLIPHLGLRYFPLASAGLWNLLGVIPDLHLSAVKLSEMRLPHLVLVASLSFDPLLCAYRIVIDQTSLLLY